MENFLFNFSNVSKVIEHLVKEALQRRDERAKKHEGGGATSAGSGLEIGPQRYHDPSVWGPNYELRGTPPGETNPAARIAEMQRVPLFSDRRFRKFARFVSKDDSLTEPQDIPG